MVSPKDDHAPTVPTGINMVTLRADHATRPCGFIRSRAAWVQAPTLRFQSAVEAERVAGFGLEVDHLVAIAHAERVAEC